MSEPIKHNTTAERATQSYLNLFKAPSGRIYREIGKTSPKDMTPTDFAILSRGRDYATSNRLDGVFPDIYETMNSLISQDMPELTEQVLPHNMTPESFQRFLLAELAKQDRVTDVLRYGRENTTTPEMPLPTKINDVAVSLKPSERQAFVIHNAVQQPTDKLHELSPGMQEIRDQVLHLTDTAALSTGYAVGAINLFNKQETPETQFPLSVQVNIDVAVENISDAKFKAMTPQEQERVVAAAREAYRAAVQEMFCNEIKKPATTRGNDIDSASAYVLGFMQARADARFGFDVTGNVGITEPCPPAQTPNTGIANGTGTSAAPTTGGGNANKATPQR